MDLKPVVWGAAAAVAVALHSVPAPAQWNNEPYRFKGVSGGAGLSTAARQAILQQQLDGREPRNLYRGADGLLLDVIERDQQAYLAEPRPNYLVNLPRSGQVFVFAGPSGLALSAGGAGVAIGGWTAMLGGYVQPAGTPGLRVSSAPVDAWVGQLDGISAVQ